MINNNRCLIIICSIIAVICLIIGYILGCTSTKNKYTNNDTELYLVQPKMKGEGIC